MHTVEQKRTPLVMGLRFSRDIALVIISGIERILSMLASIAFALFDRTIKMCRKSEL